MNLPSEKQKYLIYGLWRGDGYINVDRVYPRGGYSTISEELCHQLKLLLLRQKIVPSIYSEEEKEKKGVFHRKAYRLHIGQSSSFKNLCEILKAKYNPKTLSRERVWVDTDYVYLPIRKIVRKNYCGEVYNLEIEEKHSFCTDAFSLHNCGDVMWIYIKVGKNEKGEEIIEDIKFETFGCAAAIATSSVVTELAKGKTLKEAEKISNKDVVEFLGGLPPIKKHCSLLAEEGLKAAIDDYYKKKLDK